MLRRTTCNTTARYQPLPDNDRKTEVESPGGLGIGKAGPGPWGVPAAHCPQGGKSSACAHPTIRTGLLVGNKWCGAEETGRRLKEVCADPFGASRAIRRGR